MSITSTQFRLVAAALGAMVIVLVGVAVSLGGGVREQLAAEHVASASATATLPPFTTPQSSATQLRGFLGVFTNGVIFIQWTETDGHLAGQWQELLTSSADPYRATATNVGISGLKNGDRISLSFSILGTNTTYTGTTSGSDTLTLFMSEKTGQLTPQAFRGGTVAEYNAAAQTFQNRLDQNRLAATAVAAESANRTAQQLSKWIANAASTSACTAHSFGSSAGVTILGLSSKSNCADAMVAKFDIKNGIDVAADQVVCETTIGENQVAVTDGSGHRVGGDLCATVLSGRYPWITGAAASAQAAAAKLEEAKSAACAAIGGSYKTDGFGGSCKSTNAGKSTGGLTCSVASISFTSAGALNESDVRNVRSSYAGCYAGIR